MDVQQTAVRISQQYLADPPAGRYSDIADPDTVAMLFRATAAGLNQRDAALAAGIDPRTFQRWVSQAEAEPDSAYATFVAHLKASKAEGKLKHLENIAKHSVKEWTASAWTLERTDPEQFALRKDTDSSPRVIVQIGVSQSDVQVSVVEALSPVAPKQLP
jgi:hypothetical protein